MRAFPVQTMDQHSVQAWHALVAALAAASKRAAVMPLFECARLLATTSRWAWVLEVPPSEEEEEAASLARARGKAREGARPKACVLR